MARSSNAIFAIFLSAFFLFSVRPLLSQQSHLQTSFLAPAAIRLTNPASTVVVRVRTSPLSQRTGEGDKTRSRRPAAHCFRFFDPAGGRTIRNRQEIFTETATSSAPARSLTPQSTLCFARPQDPTDRRLFESKLEDMVDTIHHDDLAGHGRGRYGGSARL